jgi:hypothetical protein
MNKKMHNPSFGHNLLSLKRRKKKKRKTALDHWVHMECWSAYSSINTQPLFVLLSFSVTSRCLVMGMLILQG